MTSDVLDAVLTCRCEVVSARCEIVVRRENGSPESPFHAVAHRLDRHPSSPIVNELGLPLKAFGRTPEKAVEYLQAALRRRLRGGATD